MTNKTNITCILSFLIIVFLSSCTDENACPDCLELTSKSIRYIDSNENNLLFGSQAIYNPDSVVIRVGNNNTINAWKQEDSGTIVFNIEENYTNYHIVLSDTLVDTLQFELAQRKSTSCCGDVTYSTQTLLNGQEIDDNDLIVIIK